MNKQEAQLKIESLKKELSELEKIIKEEDVEYVRCIDKDGENFIYGRIYRIENKNVIDEIGDSSQFYFIVEHFTPVHKPVEGEKYYSFDNNGFKIFTNWNNDKFDNFRWKSGNVYNTEEERDKYLNEINNRNI
jgi:ribulose bisphosphate carboxylase small subunit